MVKTKHELLSSEIHQELAGVRARLGAMTKKELVVLGKESGVSPATLYRFRAASGKLPSYDTIYRVVVALGGKLTISGV